MRTIKARRTSLFAVTVSAGLAAGTVFAVPAHADTCSNNHCYATISGPGSQQAAGADIQVNCISSPNTDFIDMEMWEIMGSYWAEEGLNYGTLAANTYGNHFQWFWADNRPNGGGYHEHYISPGTSNQWVNVSIYSLGGGNWGIYRAGTSVGESTRNASTATDVDAGSETTLSTNSIAAYNDNLQYEDLSGHWHGGTPAFSRLDNPYNGVAYPGSVTGAGSHVWAGSNCPHGAAVPSGITPSPGPTAPPAFSPPAPTPSSTAAAMIPPSQASSLILPIVRQLAGLNGEANPTAIKYVATTRAKAANLTGSAVDSDQSAYMVQLNGQFNGATAHHPKGLPAPRGTVLTVVIDAATWQITDWGLTDTAAPLDQLGQVQPIG